MSAYEQKKNFVEILEHYGNVFPDKKAYISLDGDKQEEASITFAQLAYRVKQLAGALQHRRLADERILLCLPNKIEYAVAFLACLFTKAIAVPLYPLRHSWHLNRIFSVVKDSQACAIILTEDLIAKMASFQETEEGKNIQCLSVEKLLLEAESQGYFWQKPQINSNDIAFLQYTSGSTSSPKGVMVSHQNLIANGHLTQVGFRQHEQTVVATWLPFYHDMGLIGHMLQSLYEGNTNIIMTPFDFIQKPFRWLKAIFDYKVNISGAPNFAFDLCVRKVSSEQKRLLDLSSWEIAFNGAEPVRAEAIERFWENFQSCGFRKQSLSPAYGLAESTLITTCSWGLKPYRALAVQTSSLRENKITLAAEGDKSAYTIVSCGKPVAGTLEVAIVHPETLVSCQEGEVGEIWVKGNSVAQGYWGRSRETANTFQARCKDGDKGPYLRTGDLGFLYQEELFITGRIKDVIIVAGANYYPQDIELTVESCHESILANCTAAFALESSAEEKLVVLAEVDRKYNKFLLKGTKIEASSENVFEEIIHQIRLSVLKEHDLPIYDVVLIRQASIPKTSSGKIQRQACKKAYIEKTFKQLAALRSG